MSERAIEAAALQYATNLAKALARKHYPDVPQWKPADDLMTVLTQIDNMTTGMIRPAALAEDDAAVERVARALCVDDDVDPDAVGYDRTGRDLPNWYVVQGTACAALRALGE